MPLPFEALVSVPACLLSILNLRFDKAGSGKGKLFLDEVDMMVVTGIHKAGVFLESTVEISSVHTSSLLFHLSSRLFHHEIDFFCKLASRGLLIHSKHQSFTSGWER